MPDETEFLTCLLACGPPHPKEEDGPHRHTNWPKIYRWHKATFPNSKVPFGAYDFYSNYTEWWKKERYHGR